MINLKNFNSKDEFDAIWGMIESPTIGLCDNVVYVKENAPTEITFKIYNENLTEYNEYTVNNGTTWKQFLKEHECLTTSQGTSYCNGYICTVSTDEENYMTLECYDGGGSHIGLGTWYEVYLTEYFDYFDENNIEYVPYYPKIDDVILPMDYMFY